MPTFGGRGVRADRNRVPFSGEGVKCYVYFVLFLFALRRLRCTGLNRLRRNDVREAAGRAIWRLIFAFRSVTRRLRYGYVDEAIMKLVQGLCFFVQLVYICATLEISGPNVSIPTPPLPRKL